MPYTYPDPAAVALKFKGPYTYPDPAAVPLTFMVGIPAHTGDVVGFQPLHLGIPTITHTGTVSGFKPLNLGTLGMIHRGDVVGFQPLHVGQQLGLVHRGDVEPLLMLRFGAPLSPTRHFGACAALRPVRFGYAIGIKFTPRRRARAGKVYRLRLLKFGIPT